MHLYRHWQEFQSSYKDLELLKSEFPTTPTMVLTATVPPEVVNSIHKLVRDPVIDKSSINQPNILECEELPSKGKGHDFSLLQEWLRRLRIISLCVGGSKVSVVTVNAVQHHTQNGGHVFPFDV